MILDVGLDFFTEEAKIGEIGENGENEEKVEFDKELEEVIQHYKGSSSAF